MTGHGTDRQLNKLWKKRNIFRVSYFKPLSLVRISWTSILATEQMFIANKGCTVSCWTERSVNFVCETNKLPRHWTTLIGALIPPPLCNLLHICCILLQHVCLLFVSLFVGKRCSWICREIPVRQIPLNPQIQFESGPMTDPVWIWANAIFFENWLCSAELKVCQETEVSLAMKCKWNSSFPKTVNDGHLLIQCEETSRTSQELEVQQLYLHVKKPLFSSKCETSFSNSGYLKTHIMSHTGDQGYDCFQCGKAFKT